MGRDAVHGRAPRRPAEPRLERRQDSGKTPDGSYEAVLEATDAVGTAVVSLPFLLDATSSRDQARIEAAAPLGLRGRDADRPGQRRPAPAEGTGPGYLALAGIRTVRTLVVAARDAAGNKGRFPPP